MCHTPSSELQRHAEVSVYRVHGFIQLGVNFEQMARMLRLKSISNVSTVTRYTDAVYPVYEIYRSVRGECMVIGRVMYR